MPDTRRISMTDPLTGAVLWSCTFRPVTTTDVAIGCMDLSFYLTRRFFADPSPFPRMRPFRWLP